MLNYIRTTYCGFLNFFYLKKIVNLFGWINSVRIYKNIIFIILRDKNGFVQLILKNKLNNKNICDLLKIESCIFITGILFLKHEKFFDFFNSTGNIEIFCLFIYFYNISKNLPYNMNNICISYKIKLRNRFLDLRKFILYNNLFLRYNFIKYIRFFLNFENFIDVETPFLSRNTSEGSRCYLIPCRFNFGKFYVLPQSPQIFKQLLMISNFDRYYQIVKCFRDEDVRKNRQTEFTQIDCELSFLNEINIRFLFKNMILFILFKILNLKIYNNFLTIKYINSSKFFLTDKPDLRFKINYIYLINFFFYKFYLNYFFLNNYNLLIFNIPFGFNLFGKNFKNYNFFLKNFFLNKSCIIVYFLKLYYFNYFYNYLSKFNFNNIFLFEILTYLKFKNHSLIIFIIQDIYFLKNLFIFIYSICFSYFGIKNNFLNFLFIFIWVLNFNLLVYNYNFKKYIFLHNPFSCIFLLDSLYLDFEPNKCLSISYDLIINGIELGGGSIRNSSFIIQNRIFFLLYMNLEFVKFNFGFFLKSLQYGTPPHGGVGFGVDRFMIFLLGLNKIKDVIAFPKTNSNNCLLTDSPSF